MVIFRQAHSRPTSPANIENGAASTNPATSPALDEFEIGAPILTVAHDRRVDEGTELSITNIGQFTAGGIEGQGPSDNFTYSIDWGDGTPANSGTATIDVLGSAGRADRRDRSTARTPTPTTASTPSRSP